MSLTRFAFVPVATVLVFAAGLMAQVDAAAKQMIEDASKAVSELQHVTMKVKTSQPGAGGAAGPSSEIEVMMVKGKETPLQTRYKGSLFIVGEGGNKDVDVLIVSQDAPGTTPVRRLITWRDDTQKKVLTQPTGANSVSDIWVSRLERLVLGPFEPNGKTPFESEIRGRSIEVIETKEFDGVPCQVIKVDVDGKLTRTLAIGLVDKLPRFYERRLGGLAQNWTFTNVSTDKAPTAKDLEVATPKGFTAQRLADPTPTPPKTPAQPATPPGGPAGEPGKTPPAGSTPKGTGLRNPPGGLIPGAAAPAWELASVENSTVKSTDLKGKTVVLAFFGPQFPLSTSVSSALQKANSDANTKAFGVACRLQGDADVAAIKKSWADSNPGFPALVNGDDLASQLNIRGFPSVIVISPDGTVKQFIEGEVTAEKLADATAGK
ncbi:MAG: peroxiredoxin family protein [Phycisphaerales bacterium]|nr:peroxiredoxin family protein [Phycisphaerales bacterium]